MKNEYMTTLTELEAKIEGVAQRRLGLSKEEVEAMCESGEWEKDENHYALWSWLNNLIKVVQSMRTGSLTSGSGSEG